MIDNKALTFIINGYYHYCAVPEISILPPQKGLEFPGGEGWVLYNQKVFKKYMKSRRVGGS